MEGTRRSWVRGALTLAVLAAFGAAALVSNVGAVAEKKEASKKFVKKQINKLRSQIPAEGDPIFIEEEELIRFGPVQVNQDSTEHPLATIGPFSFIGICDDDGVNFDAGIEIRTSEANSAADTDAHLENDFDPSDSNGPVWWLEYVDAADDAGQDQYAGSNYMRVQSPSGTYLQGFGHLLTNFDGFDCTFAGTITQVAPS